MTMSSRRRSNRSANTPPKSPKTNVGVSEAVWTSAMVVALLWCSTRNHWAPTVCIHVPMFDTSCAMNKLR